MTENMVTIPIWLAVILITVLAGALGWVLRTVFQVQIWHEINELRKQA